MKSQTRQNRGSANYRRGLRAEFWAAAWLLLRGYRPVALRYATVLGEIDLIARRGRVLAFVEIKRRTTRETAAEAISAAQQRRIINAAEIFVDRHPRYRNFERRFDAVLISNANWPTHIKAAWHG